MTHKYTIHFSLQPLKEEAESCKMEQHLKQKHLKDYEALIKKKEENKTKRVEKVRRKILKLDKKEYKESEEGKAQKETDTIKKIIKDDARNTMNRFTGTGNLMWKHFHQMPNSEFVKCKICHRYFFLSIIIYILDIERSVHTIFETFHNFFSRVFRRYKNSMGDTTVKLLEHLQEYHKDLDDLFAL